MPASPRCLRCYQEVGPDQQQVVCPDCEGIHHDDCWNTQGGCGACAPHTGPTPSPDVLAPATGRDPTQRLTPRKPLAKPVVTQADDETVDVKQRRTLDPPPADPDDTLQLQPDSPQAASAQLAVAHEDLETAFLKRGPPPGEEQETRVLKRDPQAATDSEPLAQRDDAGSGSDVGRAHTGDATVAQPGSSGSGSDVGRAHTGDATVAQPGSSGSGSDVGRAHTGEEAVGAGAGWWEQETTPAPAAAGPTPDRVKRASDRMRKRASGVGRASARVSARTSSPGIGRRGRLVLACIGLIGVATLLTVLFLPDMFAPELLVLEPTAAQVTGTRFVVRGRVGDANPVKVHVDGVAVPVFTQGGSPSFETVVSRDALGPTTVVIEARDPAGNTTRREVRVECVAPRCELLLTSPAEGVSLGGERVLVAGKLKTDALPGSFTVHVGPLEQPLAADGSFELWLPLESSPQTVRVVVRGAGSEVEATRTVTVDRAPPRLELLRPLGAITIANELRLTARVYDAAPWVDVHLAGQVHRVERGELFTARVVLDQLGESILKLQAVDAAGLVSRPLELVINKLPPIRPRSFLQQWKANPESWRRLVLARRLDPLDDRPQQLGDKGETTALSWPLLTDFLLKKQDWFYRQAAIEAIADQVDDVFGEAIAERIRDPQTDPIVVEGLLRALGNAGDPAFVPVLSEQLTAQKWIVASAAAEALSQTPDPSAIPILISALAVEDRYLVRQAIERSLETITHHREPDAATWERWWSEHGPGFTLATVPAEPPGSLGESMTVEAAGVTLTVRLFGAGAPVFVLPELGLETAYLEQALEQLEDGLRLVYVTLPTKSDFDPPLGDPDDPEALVAFPGARFSRALSALREALVEAGQIPDEPIAIVAHGTAGWLALEHARRDTEQVDRLVLMATPPGREVWASVQRQLGLMAERYGDHELARVARSWLDVGTPPASPFSEEGQALGRAAWTSQFADTRSLAIGRVLGPLVKKRVGRTDYVVRALERPLVGLSLPEFSVADLDRHPGTPTVIAYGVHMRHYAKADFQLMARRLNRAGNVAKTLEFPRSALLPAIEENERFCAVVRRLVLGRKADPDPAADTHPGD